ncbi:MAG: transketolase family protein [Kiritimatiellae bacterium]|nr:transketolase family protein [Kiritimatiellia bacterium]
MASLDGFTMASFKEMAGRDSYGKMLAQCGEEDERVVVLNADCQHPTRATLFAARFPERNFNFGIAEANMISAAAGLAIAGKIPVAAGFGFAISLRAAEQIRTNVCYPNLNVKVVTTATGLSMGTGGPTHHCVEDLALMRGIPNITIVCPASPIENAIATRACLLEHEGPVYLRLVRGEDFGGTDEIYQKEDISFEIGKAITLREGADITLMAHGNAVGLALLCAEKLEELGVGARVINMHTVKPLDKETIWQAAEETRGIVTIEENNVAGGLGEAVAAVVAAKGRESLAPVRLVGIQDEFCKIGASKDLWVEHGLNEESVIGAARDILEG